MNNLLEKHKKVFLITIAVVAIIIFAGIYYYKTSIYKGVYIPNTNVENKIVDNVDSLKKETDKMTEKINSEVEKTVEVVNDLVKDDGVVTADELALHNTERDCWVAYKGKVYDISTWLPIHPGGVDKILPYCGKAEFEDAFIKKHGDSVDKKINNIMNKGYASEQGEYK